MVPATTVSPDLAAGPTALPGWAPIQRWAATRTPPGRLRLLMAGLLLVSLAWGGAAAWTVSVHTGATDNVVLVSEPLSLDAQQIYRSLSDADATQAAAFLSGGLEPLALRQRYLADIATAARYVQAATGAAGKSAAGSRLAILAAGLPAYAGLVETARADNRLGLPLGAAYLRAASALMRARLLPAARELYATENAQLAAADSQATGVPFLAIAAAVVGALALAWSQRWLARRTHRLLNPGLIAGSMALLIAVAWLASALTVAGTHLIDARDHGSAPVQALAAAETAVLRAHADESLTLIDRSGDDTFQQDFRTLQARLGPGRSTLLSAAVAAAAGSPGAQSASAARRAATAWYAVHERVRSLDDGGSYSEAVQLAIGTGPGGSGGLFTRVDDDLAAAISADQASFSSAALAAKADLAGLEIGVILLSVAMATGCGWGIVRRLAEFR